MVRKDFAAMEARRPPGESATTRALRSRMAHPTSLRLDELQPNPLNPRYSDADPEVRDLADTLVRVGQLQPAVIVSRDQYLTAYPEQTSRLGPQPWVVLVGNRRLAASVLAQLPTLDVRVAAELDTPEAFEDRILIENVQRKALPPLLEAEHLQRRLSRPGQTLRSVGEAIGKSHAYVRQRLDLLELIPEFQRLLRNGEISIKTGRLLGGLRPEEQRAKLALGAPFLPTELSTPAAPEPETMHGGNPVTKMEGSEGAGGAGGAVSDAGEFGNPVTNAARPEPFANQKNGTNVRPHRDAERHDVPGSHDREQVRLSVVQWLESALAELDSALPGDDDTDAERALAEAQRHILAARKALGHHA